MPRLEKCLVCYLQLYLCMRLMHQLRSRDMADLTGQPFGNYRLVRLLGQGGFADVYLAEHIHLNSQVAIKILQMRLVGNGLEQFRDEGRSIASLVHPNIIRVFDFDVKDDIPFLVMDYAPNGTLRQHYPKGSVLSAASILPYFKQVALALQYAHDHKLIHRDIKPENMLLGANGEVLLSDFGLVLSAQSTGSQTTKEMVGTLPYMAPEQINGKPRAASDQYALGIILYEWLSGDRPFSGSLVEIATQHLMTPPAPLYRKVPGVSLAIQEVVFRALAKEPLQRFANMQEFVAAFENVGRASSSLPAVPSIAAPMENTSSYPSSAPTYIKTPFSSDSQQSTFINMPGHAQPPAITPASYSQLPPTPNTPSSPQLPLVPPVQSGQSVQSSNLSSGSQPVVPVGGIDRGWTGGGQPMIPGMSNRSATPVVSSEGYQISQRGKGRFGLIVGMLLLIVVLVVGGVAYAMAGSFSSPVNTTKGRTTSTTTLVPATPALVPATSATVTITPVSTDLKNTYTISAVTGKPDVAQHQVGARFPSIPTDPKSRTVNATGIISAVQATGMLTFVQAAPAGINLSYPVNSRFSGSDGVTVEIDQAVFIASPSSGLATQVVPAHAINFGADGNIKAYDINYELQSLNSTCTDLGLIQQNLHPSSLDTPLSGGGGQWVCNRTAFTGGSNASTKVQQSDINSATSALEVNPPDAQQVLQGQVQGNERLLGTPSCKPSVNANPVVGVQAATVTVTVTFTCTGEVYDQSGALAMAEQWLAQDAAKNPGTAYTSVGKIVTMQQGQATDTGQGTITIPVIAEGVWAFQFSDAQKAQLAHLLVGKSKNDAQSILQSQQGIKQADIQLSGGNSQTLPSDSSNIAVSVQSVASSR